MKFIEVSSDYDFGALTFEQSDYFNQKSELYNRALTEDDGILSITIGGEDENEEMEINVKALDFDDVPDDFLEYVLNELCDYDMLKNTCIYKVED